MTTDVAKQTQATFKHHFEAVRARDIDAIMEDYVEESIYFTPDGPLRGLDQIRKFASELIQHSSELIDNLELTRQDVDGEILYIIWKAGELVPMGSDTFIIRDGKILVQTVAAYMAQ